MAFDPQESFERCCRLCAEEQDVTLMIFSAEAQAMLLQNKLNKYLLIEVDENDKLPKNICINCCTKLQSVCDFIDIVHKAQEELMTRSLMLDQIAVNNSSNYGNESPIMFSKSEDQIAQLEVNVDPMLVLQNNESLSPNVNDKCQSESEEIVYLNSADGEHVTIKLIKNDEASAVKGDQKVKPFCCKVCGRGYNTELALKNHSWVHNSDEKNPFICNSCNEGFENRLDLLLHLKEHRNLCLCKLCGRTFRTEKNLVFHMKGHLSETESYTCKICGRSYNTRSSLKTHSVTHSNERPFKCHLCKKSFKRNQDLKFHINQHTGEKPYKCPFCDKCFASSGNCYSHRSRMHPGRTVDNKIKKIKDPLKTNILPKPVKNTHKYIKGIFRYPCEHCDHSFLKKENYLYHMYQHTGVKPYQCSYCNETFVTKKGLYFHHGKEHPQKDRPLALISKNALLK